MLPTGINTAFQQDEMRHKLKGDLFNYLYFNYLLQDHKLSPYSK